MKEQVANQISKYVSLDKNAILNSIEIPPSSELGDFSFPCFLLAKELKKNPIEIARELATKINSSEFEKVESKGPYVNFFLNKKTIAESTLKLVLKQKDKYGSSNEFKKETLVIDMSSPNIAKPFGIGHLRSTIIGNSLAKIHEFLGYKVIKINYLGDWGTQFGKLIVGYKKFGDDKKLKQNPIRHLLELYIIGNNEEYADEARSWFKKLEDGDKEATRLWKLFRSYSLIDFDKIYKLLGVKFDVISGESNYNKLMEKTIVSLEKLNLLKKSEGAEGVDLENFNLGFCLIKKSDGATLYATRDITAALDRYNKYNFSKIIYEVGQEQTLHFKQVFKVLELMGNKWAKNCNHVSHGFYLDQEGKKFATRKGKSVFMEDVLAETIELSKKEVIKREKLSEKELKKRAEAIARAAIFYGDLKNNRSNDIVFDIEKFTSFEGNTGPYLLYSYARAKNILKKAKYKNSLKILIKNLSPKEKELVIKIQNFPEVVKHAYTNLAPNLIANYSFELAQLFNEFYQLEQVIGSENENVKLAIVNSFSIVLKNALSLLGIETLERM